LEEKAKEPIKVLDRRHFTSAGARRSPDAEQEASAQPEAPAPPKAESRPREQTREAPPPAEPEPSAFSDLVISLAQSCFLSLGLVPSPISGRPEVSLPAAASMLDMLDMLREKTKGNLTDQEQEFLDHTLLQLKVGYVQATKAAGAQGGGA